jgi:hypothetical protein
MDRRHKIQGVRGPNYKFQDLFVSSVELKWTVSLFLYSVGAFLQISMAEGVWIISSRWITICGQD